MRYTICKIYSRVKCQNLCYLNLSFYFNHLCHFLCSLPSTCCYCLATPLPSCSAAVILSTPFHSSQHTTFAPTRQQNRCNSARFCAISHRHFVYSITLLSAHPSFYFASQLFPQLHFVNAVVKLLFPSTFFSLCRSNHANQFAASTTQNVIHLLHSYNIRHFHIKSSFSSPLRLDFSSPSTPQFYWFPPHIFLFQL